MNKSTYRYTEAWAYNYALRINALGVQFHISSHKIKAKGRNTQLEGSHNTYVTDEADKSDYLEFYNRSNLYSRGEYNYTVNVDRPS